MSGKVTQFMAKPTAPLHNPSISGSGANTLGNFIVHNGQRVKNESNVGNVHPASRVTMASNLYPRTNAVAFMDRTMRDLRGADVPLKRKDSEAMQSFAKTFTGGTIPIPATDMVPFKKQFLPGGGGSNDIKTFVAKLRNVYGGSFGQDMRLILPLVLNGDNYGPASRNKNAMKLLLPVGAPVFSRKRKLNDHKNAETECITVFDVNKLQKQIAMSRRKKQVTCSDFYQVWSDCGIIAAIEQHNPTFKDNINLWAMCNYSQADEIECLWLDWPERLHIGNTCWLVWVMRSEGFEEEERDFMLRGEPGMFRDWLNIKVRDQSILQRTVVQQTNEYELSIKRLQEATASIGTVSTSLTMPNETRRAHGEGMVFSREREREATPFATAVRYGRWEPYVTDGARPVPKWVTHGVNPDGTYWKGRPRRVCTILKDIREFDFADRWRVKVRAVMYPNPNAPAGQAENTTKLFKSLPRMRAYIYGS